MWLHYFITVGGLLFCQTANAAVVGHSLKFPAGKLSSISAACVAVSDQDRYLLQAQAGQYLSTTVTALKNNAKLAIEYQIDGQAKTLMMNNPSHRKAWYGQLPKADNDVYQLLITPVAETSCYELFVGISASFNPQQLQQMQQLAQQTQIIDQAVALMNEAKDHYQPKTVIRNDLSDQGGKATFFYNDKQELSLLVLSIYFSNGEVHNCFYFDGQQQLLFMANEGHAYNAPLNSPQQNLSQTRISHHGYYYKNNQLIQWVDDEGRKISSGNAFSQRGAKIETLLNTLLKKKP